jgi:hypothetical protein
MDVAQNMLTLDEWAKLVDKVTRQTLFHFKTNPAAFNNSEGVFRMLALSSVLKRNLGVHYNPELKADSVPDDVFNRDANNCFICGVLSEKRTGTCASLPVLFVAVGRRLGYPLKLVTTASHFFVRWDGGAGKERFNIEVTNDKGVNFHPDDYYRTWPQPLSENQIRAAQYLENMSAADELAAFLISRGCNLVANNAIDEALELPSLQCRLAPRNYCYHVIAVNSLESVRQELMDYPSNFSKLLPVLRQQYGVNSAEETNVLASYNQRLQRLEQMKVALAGAVNQDHSN